jgi:hypothetical protein
VEIGRFAESSDADLVVMGRKDHEVILEHHNGTWIRLIGRNRY